MAQYYIITIIVYFNFNLLPSFMISEIPILSSEHIAKGFKKIEIIESN